MDEAQRLQSLSALADGELGPAETTALTAAWRDDAQLRERWHTYQLIGDVLRSDELASDAAADAAFLQRLRTRLADEPVVLAPAAVEPGVRGGKARRWATPVAVAAGFVLVIGALTVTRAPVVPAEAGAPQLAQTPVPAPAVAALVGPLPAMAQAEGQQGDRAELASGVLIRDARLDEYLEAHKQFSGSSVLGVPSGFLRSATYERPAAAAAGAR